MTDVGTKNPKIAVLNGSPTDNNATLFAQGYNAVHQPEVRLRRAGRRSTTRACRTGTTRRAARSSSRCSPRPAARSTACSPPTTASAARRSPCSRRTTCRCPSPARTPRVEGLQNILTGDQCMTVYKAVKTEAEGRRHAALALLAGQTAGHHRHGRTTRRQPDVPSVLATPVAIYKDNIKSSPTTASSGRICTARCSQSHGRPA